LLGQYPSEEDIAAVQIGQATRPIGKPRNVANVSWPIGSDKTTPDDSLALPEKP